MIKTLLACAGLYLIVPHSAGANDVSKDTTLINIESQEIYVGTVETISLPPVARKVIVDNVNLIPKSSGNLASKLVFSGPLQQVSNEQEPIVDIQINNISTMSNGPLRDLNIGFRNLRVGALTIQSSQDAASSIRLSISFENNATSNSVSLVRGSYAEIDLKIDSEESQLGRSRTISIHVDDFENIVIAGKKGRPPISLDIHTQYAEKPRHAGAPLIELYQLQLLEGIIDVRSEAPNIGNGNFISPGVNCTKDGNRLHTKLREITLGDDKPREFNINFPMQKCMEFSMQSVKGAGHLALKGGILRTLVLDGVHSEGLRGLDFSSESRGLESLRVTSAELKSLDIKTHDAGVENSLQIPTWGTVHVDGAVSLPHYMYQELDHLLQDHANERTVLTSGVRRFLAQSTWDSYFSETQRPASNEALYSLLKSDSKRIYGPIGARALEYFTGFGIQLLNPLITFLVYSLLFIGLSVSLGAAPNIQSRFICFLKNVIPGGSPDETDIRVHRFGLAYRFFVLIQIALVSLFIQNAVLVGS